MRYIETILEVGTYLSVLLMQVLYFVSHQDRYIGLFEQNAKPDTGDVLAQARGACLPTTTEVEPAETGDSRPVSAAVREVACSSR